MRARPGEARGTLVGVTRVWLSQTQGCPCLVSSRPGAERTLQGLPTPRRMPPWAEHDGSPSRSWELRKEDWVWGGGGELNKSTLSSLFTAFWGFSGFVRLALARFVPVYPNSEMPLALPSLHSQSPQTLKGISSEQPEGERGIDRMNSDKDNCATPLSFSPEYGSTLSVFILFKSRSQGPPAGEGTVGDGERDRGCRPGHDLTPRCGHLLGRGPRRCKSQGFLRLGD